MSELLLALLAITGTIVLYILAQIFQKKVKTPLAQPIIVVSLIVIIFLLLFDIPYETYMLGGQWIELLMGPAVVALALPLYNHFDMLKKLAWPVIAGVTTGAFVGVSSGLLLARGFGFSREYILAVVPKSVTTPVAVSIAETLEGPMSLAAVFVIIAGVSGVIMSPAVQQLFKLQHPIGKGIGMGSASHAIGTGASMNEDEVEGSFSTIAMVLSAVIVSIIAPLLVMLLL